MNIKQLLLEQKKLIATITDENTASQTAYTYRTWLAESLGKNSSFLIAHDDYELSEAQLTHYEQGLARLQNGVPLAYVTGHQPFYRLNFQVNEHTLIPRADTEVLLTTALDFYDCTYKGIAKKQPVTVLDLGTGSGCVAISIAHYLQSQRQVYQVIATDFSHEALQVAQHNAKANGVSVHLLQGSWFEALPTLQKFDMIVSNPPYIDPADPHLADLADEPITALVANDHGLADIFHIIQQAKNYLENGGLLAIEHGYDQGMAVQDYFMQQGYRMVKTHKDYGNNDRVTCAIWHLSIK